MSFSFIVVQGPFVPPFPSQQRALKQDNVSALFLTVLLRML
jgi:hypothetical protein